MLALASLDLACRDHSPDVSATLTTTAFDRSSSRWLGLSDLIAETRRAFLHLSYSCAQPFGPAMLVTHDPNRTSADIQNYMDGKPHAHLPEWYSLAVGMPGVGHMRRREFLGVLGGAVAWPLDASAQQGERIRRVGVLMLYAENDPAGQLRANAFRQGLERLGWIAGRNLRIDYHWGIGDAGWIQSGIAQLLQLGPDLILANGGAVARVAQQATRTVPVIFLGTADPVADGFVRSLARPGGNLTGFTVLEPSMGAKLLELLKEIAPRITRVAVMINPDNPSGRRLHDAAAGAAQRFAVSVVVAPVREPGEIEAAMTKLAREPDYGLIVPPDPSTNTKRRLIIELAARHRLPAVYALRVASLDGGLLSYGVDLPELFRQAAVYADRILRGDKPADLPVQQPTKFELVINLKTAKALGLDVPPMLLARADEVIE